MCCDNQSGQPCDGEEGECPDCGALTYGGYSAEICGYSPIMCNTCLDAPCDGSC